MHKPSHGQLTGNLWSSLASHLRLLASREGFLREVARMLKGEAMKDHQPGEFTFKSSLI